MTGEETFEFAAAVAGVSVGLAAVLILAILAIIGSWRLFRHASEAQQAAMEASITVAEMVRRIESPVAPAADAGASAELRREIETLILQQRQLQDSARGMLDTAAVAGGPAPHELEELKATVSRLDITVGQMATSLANLIRILEQQQGRQ
ncbi:MAG: hypothetical protein J4O04_07025 [Chloroflexi bacterium]|nr:hypothetical protein [Chloroflexota bacterium]